MAKERQEARWRKALVGALLGLAVFLSMTLVWFCWLAERKPCYADVQALGIHPPISKPATGLNRTEEGA